MSEISFSDPVEQGLTLSEKAVDVHIVNGVDVLARWYHSPYGADLMLWCDSDGNPSRFQLNSTGQIVDWSKGDGVQTGLIVEFEVSAEGRASSRAEVTETIQFDVQPNSSTISVARLVIGSGVGIPQAVRSQMQSYLDDVRPAKSSRRQSRTRFWNRFKHWTTGS